MRSVQNAVSSRYPKLRNAVKTCRQVSGLGLPWATPKIALQLKLECLHGTGVDSGDIGCAKPQYKVCLSNVGPNPYIYMLSVDVPCAVNVPCTLGWFFSGNAPVPLPCLQRCKSMVSVSVEDTLDKLYHASQHSADLINTLQNLDQARTGCVTLDAFLTACARAGLTLKPEELEVRQLCSLSAWTFVLRLAYDWLKSCMYIAYWYILSGV